MAALELFWRPSRLANSPAGSSWRDRSSISSPVVRRNQVPKASPSSTQIESARGSHHDRRLAQATSSLASPAPGQPSRPTHPFLPAQPSPSSLPLLTPKASAAKVPTHNEAAGPCPSSLRGGAQARVVRARACAQGGSLPRPPQAAAAKVPTHHEAAGPSPSTLPRPPQASAAKALTHDNIGEQPQAPPASPMAPPLTDAQEATKDQPFLWSQHWFCVGASNCLDKTRPHPVMLLGKRLVLWWDEPASTSNESQTSGSHAAASLPANDDGSHTTACHPAWRCFLDQCPHRLVPLSEGRIDEQGLLQCSYHGWTFAGDGGCQGIPQAAETGPEKNSIKSPRACATPFPIREAQGLLFVWPEAGPGAEAMSALTPLPFPKGIMGSKVPYRLSTFTRELPYGYEMLAENVMDPSHLPFAHHGVGQLRRSQAAHYPSATVPSQLEGVQGYLGRYIDPGLKAVIFVNFQAPSLFVYHRALTQSPEYVNSEGGAVTDPEGALERLTAGELGPVSITALFITPTTPGRSRLTMLSGSNRPPAEVKTSVLFKFLVSLKFYGHWILNDILDGDSYFLHGQEKATQMVTAGQAAAPGSRESSASLVTSAYFFPTSADRLVIAFRKWLDRVGGSITWPSQYQASAPSPDLLPKRVVLDRYSSHTANCTICLEALKKVQTVQGVLRGLTLGLLALQAQHGLGWFARAGLAALACLAALGSLKCEGYIDKFTYVGYDHASRK